MTGAEALPRHRYLREAIQCRIVFSPFGWGEVCFRDFEAVACGSVLLKPDMSHVETWPDVFEAGVTYVPVRWDLSDLAERIEQVLDHPAEAEAMVKEAARRIERAVVERRFGTELRALLAHVGLGG